VFTVNGQDNQVAAEQGKDCRGSAPEKYVFFLCLTQVINKIPDKKDDSFEES
jgi:hypothetical protein